MKDVNPRIDRAARRQSAWERARAAVRELVEQPHLGGVMIATVAHDAGSQTIIPDEQIYREVAHAAGLDLAVSVRSERRGRIHTVSMVRPSEGHPAPSRVRDVNVMQFGDAAPTT